MEKRRPFARIIKNGIIDIRRYLLIGTKVAEHPLIAVFRRFNRLREELRRARSSSRCPINYSTIIRYTAILIRDTRDIHRRVILLKKNTHTKKTVAINRYDTDTFDYPRVRKITSRCSECRTHERRYFHLRLTL